MATLEEQKAFYDGKIDKEYKAGYGTVAVRNLRKDAFWGAT